MKPVRQPQQSPSKVAATVKVKAKLLPALKPVTRYLQGGKK